MLFCEVESKLWYFFVPTFEAWGVVFYIRFFGAVGKFFQIPGARMIGRNFAFRYGHGGIVIRVYRVKDKSSVPFKNPRFTTIQLRHL